jgi:F0F1-type ATP synthase membrane subunit b/b'
MNFKPILLLALAATLAGCTHEQDPAKTREQAAQAAAKLKQESKQAGQELKKGAAEAGRQGRAIAEGAREGWNSDSSKSKAKPSPAKVN